MPQLCLGILTNLLADTHLPVEEDHDLCSFHNTPPSIFRTRRFKGGKSHGIILQNVNYIPINQNYIIIFKKFNI